MGTITIQVDAEVAKAYQEINSTNRKRIEMLFNILLQKELKEISLIQIMDDIGYKAEKNQGYFILKMRLRVSSPKAHLR